jgi:hypothetical protein
MKVHDICDNCLTDLIGITGCETPTPCKLRIDSIGGISADFLEAIADPNKHASYYEVLENAKANALGVFKSNIIDSFGRYASFQKEVLKMDFVDTFRPLTAFSSTKQNYGLVINLEKAQHQVLEIKRVSFYPKNAGTVTLSIIDLLTKNVLYTVDIAVVEKYYSYELKKTFIAELQTESVIVTISSADVAFNLMNCNDNSFDSCSCLCSKYSESTTTQAVEFDNVIELDSEMVLANGSPLCVIANVDCDIMQIICDYKDSLADAYMLQVYMQIVQLQIDSPQINYLKERNLEAIIKDILPEKRKQYYSYLNREVKNISKNLVGNSICFSCMPESGGGFIIASRS